MQRIDLHKKEEEEEEEKQKRRQNRLIEAPEWFLLLPFSIDFNRFYVVLVRSK